MSSWNNNNKKKYIFDEVQTKNIKILYTAWKLERQKKSFRIKRLMALMHNKVP
jgi:hypothetical protein